ncbi:cell surface A33 antigen-like [Morone saxatilis]|uniref:cell surface A33 antigen-like n=1 Tax=Morone saxatilis TaxID=34816 RepID=UPI0015E21610|nr:cell surface A33 antigen-like [Morone saxatilis]
MVGHFNPLSAMMTKKQFGWRKLFLILTVLPCCRSVEVSIPQKNYEVVSGDDITMTCSFVPARTDYSNLVLTWEAYPVKPGDTIKSVATYFLNSVVNIPPAYEGRAFMEVDLHQKVSTLRLTKVTMQDSRSYQCSVKIPDDDEGTPAATTSLLVLVPPSPPVCSIQGKAEYWENINLTCKSEEGSPTPVPVWKSYSVNNIPRQFPVKTTEKDGVLSLFNISREMSGFFICTSTNRVGSASCNLTLAVMPPSMMNIGSTAGIIGGVLAGLVFLGILIFCCCRKKGKDAEGAPGEVFYDRDAPEAEEEYCDDKAASEKQQPYQKEYTDVVPQSNYSVGTAGHKIEDDQHSYNSGKERHGGKGSDIDSRRYQDDQQDHYHGSRDRLDDQRDRYGGSRDPPLTDQTAIVTGGTLRDRPLTTPRTKMPGSRDRLDDQRDHYGGSRDRLDDRRDLYGGSRDRLDDHGNHYRSSRDRLDYIDDQ